MTQPISIMLHVTSDDPAVIQKTVEHFTRVMTGLALDGVKTFLSVDQERDE